MDRICSYPKVYNLGHPQIAGLLDGEVVVEEKVDGSQFSFGVFGGELKCRSKGKELVADAPEKMFQRAIDSVRERLDKLEDGTIYRCEYLQKPKHNSLAYERVPEGNLILFDVDDGMQNYGKPEVKQTYAERIGLECVPVVHIGAISNPEELKVMLERDSILGGVKVEGVVVKNYSKFTRDGKAMMGKHVSEAFKEKHEKEWRKSNPSNSDVVQALGQSLRTEARWEKAIQHLRESGRITDTPKDIGALIKEIESDTRAECEDEIKAALFKYAWPKISRIVKAGVPDWYKEKLMAKQFEATE